MAHDPHAREWIKNVNKARAQADGFVQPYFDRFIQGKEVPTRQDVANLVKIMNEAQKMTKLIYSDLEEMEGAMQGFGGAGDTWFRNNQTMLQAIQRKAH